MKSCPECNSQEIIKDVKVLDRGDQYSTNIMQVAVDEYPDALIFKQRNYSNVKAEVCAGCGFIQFYAIDPVKLLHAYQNRQNEL